MGLYEPCPCPQLCLELIPAVAGSCLEMSSSHNTRYCRPYANSLGMRWCFAAAVQSCVGAGSQLGWVSSRSLRLSALVTSPSLLASRVSLGEKWSVPGQS